MQRMKFSFCRIQICGPLFPLKPLLCFFAGNRYLATPGMNRKEAFCPQLKEIFSTDISRKGTGHPSWDKLVMFCAIVLGAMYSLGGVNVVEWENVESGDFIAHFIGLV